MEKEWFDQLTEVQKAKLRGLEDSTEALIAFCKEENLDMPDDLLESVSGGSDGSCDHCNHCYYEWVIPR